MGRSYCEILAVEKTVERTRGAPILDCATGDKKQEMCQKVSRRANQPRPLVPPESAWASQTRRWRWRCCIWRLRRPWICRSAKRLTVDQSRLSQCVVCGCDMLLAPPITSWAAALFRLYTGLGFAHGYCRPWRSEKRTVVVVDCAGLSISHCRIHADCSS